MTPRASGYSFLGSWGGVWPSKHSNVVARHHRWNKGALWGKFTLTPPPQITCDCLEGCSPSIRRISTRCNSSCGALRGHFCQQWPWLWWLLCMFCRVSEHEPLLSGRTAANCVSPESSCREQDNSRSALILRRRKQKRNGESNADFLHRSANYLRFLTILVSCSYLLYVWPQSATPNWGSLHLRFH